MSETLAALLLAHVLADFVFQTDAMARNKDRPLVLLLHAGIVLALSLLAAGQIWSPAIAILALAHLAIDTVKEHGLRSAIPGKVTRFLLDQAAHLATILIVALVAPTLWSAGWWPGLMPDPVEPWLPAAMAWGAGLILTMRGGGFAVAMLLEPYSDIWRNAAEGSGSLPEAGRIIGLLERGLAFILVTAGYPTGVAFLITAKSLLRFNDTRQDRGIAEYVIIGTLASIGWALLVAFATEMLIADLLPAPP